MEAARSLDPFGRVHWSGKDRIQLDLVPETANPPRDEYGVSFVGFHGNTPILPGGCPAAPAGAATQDSAGIPNFAVISFQ